MRNIGFLSFLLLILISFSSCNQHYFEKEIRFENQNWNKFNEIKFQIPVEAGKTYDFTGNIYTDSSFSRRKIEMGFYLYLPTGERRLSDLTFRVLDLEYQPNGEKTNIGFKNPVIFKENISSEEGGMLDIKLVLHSQYYDNQGIIGIDVFATEK